MSFAESTGLWGMTNATQAHITQVGRVIVPVSDQDRALEFYRDVLGFEVRGDTAYGEGERWLEVAPPGAATSIAIVETRLAWATDDVRAQYDDLRGQGVEVDAEFMGGEGPVPPMFCFRDPDGNNFLVVEDPQPGT
jgi:catechol 2,3-dioxygenase-like lactoylglutathione lyase family enzyme